MEPALKKSKLLMIEDVEICEKEFTTFCLTPRKKPKRCGWFNLPNEIRVSIIEMMDFDTLCRFAQCSVVCNEEAIRAKSYIRKIVLKRYDKTYWKICFLQKNGNEVWTLDFQPKDDMTVVRYMSDSNVHWTCEEEGECVDVFIRYVNSYLKKWKGILEEFEMPEVMNSGSTLLQNLRLRNMKRLESLIIREQCVVSVTKPKIVGVKLLSSVAKTIKISFASITFSQLVQLKAENIEMTFSQFTPKLINKYIKHWREGKIDRNVRNVCLRGYSSCSTEADLCGLDLEAHRKTADNVFFTIVSRCETMKAHVKLSRVCPKFEMAIEYDQK